ncbi:MAG: U32 family peptidase [Clostridia bacterium]|nr:U32 family peptidase [Clostridia bacterium]
MIEILAPAGDEKCAYAAINAGANAIYLGMSSFSARSSAANFGREQLEKLIAHAHLFGVKIYVAMNTLVKMSELQSFIDTAVEVHNLGADAIIIQDIYLGAYLKKTYPQMCLHLSTQAGICNALGAKYAKELGFSRVILARETKLSDIAEIAKIIETEVFVQGALCTCFSGQCYLSSFAGGNSGNRGKCKQPCRKQYKIDRKGFEEYAYRISLSDLCVGEDVEKLVEAGVSSFKIEGRMRRPEYVSAAVNYYKNIIDGSVKNSDLSALKRTYNRGNYTKGLAFGQDKSFISSAVQGNIGEYVGNICVESGKYICRTSDRFGEGDGFKIMRGGRELCGAAFGESVKGGFALKCSTRLKNGDKVFITTDAALNQSLLDGKRTYKVTLQAEFKEGEPPKVTLNGRTYTAHFTAEQAKARPFSKEDLINCFNKTDLYPFEITYKNLQIDPGVFIPASQLNAFRREVFFSFYTDNSATVRDIIATIQPLPQFNESGICSKTAVIAGNLNGVKADIGILKPTSYSGGLQGLVKGFSGEKFLYLPSYLSGDELEAVIPLINAFDGIYCGGNYSVPLAKRLNKKLFAGVGFNLFNALSVKECPADYVALSKELTLSEAKEIAQSNTFYLSMGGVKVMDLIYCPFAKTCGQCDKRSVYKLTDENGREFPLRRYETGVCRFEIYNCAPLVCKNNFTGVLADLTLEENPAATSKFADDTDKLKSIFKNYTKGHSENGVL